LAGLIVVGAILIAAALPTGATTQAAQVIKRASSAIAITTDGSTLLAVNPDSNSLTLVDTASETVIDELAVGTDPRTIAVDDAGQRAYVANRGSESISVVDLSARSVISEVVVGHRPYGVVVSPDGAWVYAAVQGLDQIVVLDATTLQVSTTYSVTDRPSGLAISDDGRTLYVTHLLENTITVLTVQPFRIYLPAISRTLSPTRPSSRPPSGMPAPHSVYRPSQHHSPSTSPPSTVSLTVYRPPHAHSPSSPSLSTSIPLWTDSNLLQSIVLSPDDSRAYVPHTRSNTVNKALGFDSTVFPIISLIDTAARQHLIGQQFDIGFIDVPGVGLPFDAAVTPSGDELWILNAASNDISVMDLDSRSLAAHIEVSHNPRGIVLSPDGTSAYVNNTLAGTVSVVDVASYGVTGVITVTDIPLPPTLLNGKRLFHSSDDPRMALAQWVACNSCHFEGEHDGRTWFFGFAGPRNTTGLLGMVETYPLRWSAEWDESADSEYVVRRENFGSGLIPGSFSNVNCDIFPPDCVNHPPNQGRSYDLDCLAAFMDSLEVPLSPAHAHGEPLSAAEQRGQALFNDPELGCATCHPAPLYTDLLTHNVGTATSSEKIGPAYDTPTLRSLYDSAPYFHDGSAVTLYDTLTRPSPGSEHDVSGLLTESEIDDLIAFLMALPFTP
jgi:YVTN family beta-propeller protein